MEQYYDFVNHSIFNIDFFSINANLFLKKNVKHSYKILIYLPY